MTRLFQNCSLMIRLLQMWCTTYLFIRRCGTGYSQPREYYSIATWLSTCLNKKVDINLVDGAECNQHYPIVLPSAGLLQIIIDRSPLATYIQRFNVEIMSRSQLVWHLSKRSGVQFPALSKLFNMAHPVSWGHLDSYLIEKWRIWLRKSPLSDLRERNANHIVPSSYHLLDTGSLGSCKPQIYFFNYDKYWWLKFRWRFFH